MKARLWFVSLLSLEGSGSAIQQISQMLVCVHEAYLSKHKIGLCLKLDMVDSNSTNSDGGLIQCMSSRKI